MIQGCVKSAYGLFDCVGNGTGNDAPTIRDCPVTIVELRVLREPVLLTVPLGFNLNISDDELYAIEVTTESFPVLSFVNASMDMSGGMVINLPGAEIPSAYDNVQINFTITVTDTENTMSACDFGILIELFETDTCMNEHPPLLDFLVSFTSVTVVVDTSQDMV